MALLSALLGSVPAPAQIQYGVKGGVNHSALRYPFDDIDAMSNHFGFFIGPSLKMSGAHGLGFDAALLYDRRGAEIEPAIVGAPIYPTTITQQQIAVPVNLRYDYTLSRRVGVFGFAGPQVGFSIGEDHFKTAYGDWDLKKTQLSVNIGVGITLGRHGQVAVGYNLACSKTADITINKHLGNQLEQTVGHGKISAWQISLGYYF